MSATDLANAPQFPLVHPRPLSPSHELANRLLQLVNEAVLHQGYGLPYELERSIDAYLSGDHE